MSARAMIGGDSNAPRRSAALRAAAALAGLLTSVTAGALEWQTAPTVSLQSTGDDNYRMRLTDVREVNSSRLDASANIEGSSDRLTLSVRPRFRAINFNDDREFDRNDKYLSTSLGLGAEHQRVTLSADFVRDGTLTNSLEETGYTEVDAERDRTIYGLGWNAATGERGVFSLSLNAQSMDYIDELIGSPLVDYDYSSAALGYRYQLSERGAFSVSLSAGELDTQSMFGITENIGLSVQYERALSESLTMRIGAGQYETRRPSLFLADDRDSSVDFSLDKRWNRWTMTTSLRADIEPSAFGVLFRRETAAVRVRRRFSERVEGGLSLSSGRVRSDEPLLFYEDRRYAFGQFNVDWRVAERLWLSFDVGTRAQEFAVSDRARAAFAQIAFTYRGRGS